MSKVESISIRSQKTKAEAIIADQRLAVRLAAGDGVAWRSFLNTHGRLIRARVADVAASFGRAQDESAIDDATADVFSALLGNDAAALRAFGGKSLLSTYVAIIATRVATRGFAAKRETRESQQLTDLQETATQEPTNDACVKLIAEERLEQMRVVLHELPFKQRAVVELFHLEGYSYFEVSEKLKMPIGSVGVTLKRAESKIRQLLDPD